MGVFYVRIFFLSFGINFTRRIYVYVGIFVYRRFKRLRAMSTLKFIPAYCTIFFGKRKDTRKTIVLPVSSNGNAIRGYKVSYRVAMRPFYLFISSLFKSILYTRGARIDHRPRRKHSNIARMYM